MLPVQARLLEVARALRYGSNARLLVLRATQEGMANLLKQVPQKPAPTPPSKPTVLPARAAPAGMPDAALARNAETLLAGQSAALVTQAYVEAGARLGATASETTRDNAALVALPGSGDQTTPLQSFDPRAVSLPGQLSKIIDHEDDELRPSDKKRKALALSGSSGDRGEASPLIDRRVVFFAVGGLLAALLAGLLKALF
jgi:hypothetical protein